MESRPCPKCNELMDESRLSLTGSDYVGYVSNKQTGMLRTVTTVQLARAYPNCGYMEMYLDPKELKSRIS